MGSLNNTYYLFTLLPYGIIALYNTSYSTLCYYDII